MKRLVCACALALALVSPAAASAQQPSQPAPAARDEYVPVSELPDAAEHLPAAPFVLTAYAFMWLATLAYVWTIWRRMRAVDQELAALRRDISGKA